MRFHFAATGQPGEMAGQRALFLLNLDDGNKLACADAGLGALCKGPTLKGRCFGNIRLICMRSIKGADEWDVAALAKELV